MILKSNKSLELDGRELKALLAFRGKTDTTRKIVIMVANESVCATSRNGVGAAVYIRGTVSGTGANHDWELDATPLQSIKFGNDDTIAFSITKGGNLGRVSVKGPGDSAEAMDFFSVEKYCSTQSKIGGILDIPEPPNVELAPPYSIALDWGIMGMISTLTKLANTFHVEIYTPREGGNPYYVELGRKRPEGGTNWFATFLPWRDDDELEDDDGSQLDIDDQADPAGGDED